MTLFTLALATAALAAEPSAGDARPPVRVLLVTGVDHPAHAWRETAPAWREVLEADKACEVRCVDDPEVLGTDLMFDYEVVVLHFKNHQPLRRQEEAQANLQKFVGNGGGLVVLHFACGAFEEWPVYADLIGKVWDRKNTHDPRGPFRVSIVGKHPITKDLNDFETDDELYTCLAGERPVDLLAVARSRVTGQDHPMAFALAYEKGRVFHTSLGHDVKAIRMPGTAELVRRGCLWAAGRN